MFSKQVKYIAGQMVINDTEKNQAEKGDKLFVGGE